MKDKSSVHFIFYIVESSHAHQHCLHAWPTLIHGNSGHVAVRAGARERCLMNRSLDARSWSACSWLLYCSMQRVMFRPCTHLSDHDTWSNQKVTWSNTCPSRDWPYVMSRQNNQTERDQLMVNSLLYEWCTFPWLYLLDIKQCGPLHHQVINIPITKHTTCLIFTSLEGPLNNLGSWNGPLQLPFHSKTSKLPMFFLMPQILYSHCFGIVKNISSVNFTYSS